MNRLALPLIGLALGLMALPVSAQELRSDSPLWTYDSEPNEALFPRFFTDEESFGCIHIIRTGLYRWASVDGGELEYWRVDNYGVFHCALIVGVSPELNEAKDAFDDHAWIVRLDRVVEADGSETELLAFQIGIRTGSRYVLLRRRKSDMTHLEELAPECPETAERRTARIDIWGQDVCVVASQEQLRSIAQTANRRPAAARLDWMIDPLNPEPGP